MCSSALATKSYSSQVQLRFVPYKRTQKSHVSLKFVQSSSGEKFLWYATQMAFNSLVKSFISYIREPVQVSKERS
jgi:hypothetical protein